MSESAAGNLSEDDAQLIEGNQLGAPRGIYRLKAGYIRFYRYIGLALLIFCVIIVVFIAIAALLGLPKPPAQQFYFLAFLSAMSCLVPGLFIELIVVPHMMNERIIICESGMLQVRNNRATVVRWEDLVAIRQGLGGLDCSIRLRGGKTLDFHRFYTNCEELLALIRQRGGQRDV